MQAMKTGALIRAAVRMGAILGGADDERSLQLTDYAEAAGRAFQLADDILDVTASPEAMGKATGKDAGAGKQTLVARIGVDAARRRLGDLVHDAITALTPFGPEADGLRADRPLFRHARELSRWAIDNRPAPTASARPESCSHRRSSVIRPRSRASPYRPTASHLPTSDLLGSRCPSRYRGTCLRSTHRPSPALFAPTTMLRSLARSERVDAGHFACRASASQPSAARPARARATASRRSRHGMLLEVDDGPSPPAMACAGRTPSAWRRASSDCAEVVADACGRLVLRVAPAGRHAPPGGRARRRLMRPTPHVSATSSVSSCSQPARRIDVLDAELVAGIREGGDESKPSRPQHAWRL